jgi:hypothetical protein
MAELGFQVSTKTADGTIFVIADATYAGFTQKLSEALDPSGAEALLQSMATAFAGQPMSTQQIANALGGTVISSDKWGGSAPVAQQPAGQVCKHGEPAKLVPAGVSKASGKPYRAFYACQRPQGQQCDFRANAS